MHIICIGSGGIAQALAKVAKDHNDSFSCISRNAESLAQINSINPCNFSKVLDASSWDDMGSAVAELTTHVADEPLGIINTAGSILLKPADRTSEAEYLHTIQQNITTAFLTVQLAVKLKRPSNVLLLSSVAAQVGLKNHEAIAAAKGAVEALTRSAAATYAKRNIRFNALALGLVDTPMASFITGNAAGLQASEKMHPLGRIGTAAEIGQLAYQMLHPANSWMTGSVIPVDGGLSQCRPQ